MYKFILKLYEAEDLIEELAQAKPKHLSEENATPAGVEFGSSSAEVKK